ncbi:transporter substrate-binding domain-containing protein [Maridesulfovibrio sp.]|uniref:substrate-binding periplasmic protein n=1 Tax=Maridesulfovibrio sp. TaxID=2795000 RepID=UPI002A18CC4F|nr:transporter substrate-binding domain-containing protein [Maridesulfovibrio sp.]
MFLPRILKIFLFLQVLCLCLPAFAYAGKTISLASIDWPPYTGRNLEGEGESAKLVRAAFAAMGYELKIVFVPWKRAMRMAEKGRQVAGYFPEYYSPGRAEKFIFSKSFNCSPVSLVTRRDNMLKWDGVDSLAGHRIGFVSGYVNTPALDVAVANGTILADYASYDESNVLKVAAGRVEGAVIDPYVFRYLAEMSPAVSAVKEELVVSGTNFGVNELYIAFSRDSIGRRCADIFNKGLMIVRGKSGRVPCEKNK